MGGGGVMFIYLTKIIVATTYLPKVFFSVFFLNNFS